jgi:UDP-N-acetylglucosamine 2-epimerase (non-hydrolysing)
MDAGTLIMSGLKPQGVMSALRVILSQNETDERVAPLVDDYRTTLVSKQVVRVVLSYIGYINHCVWRK